MSDVEQRFERIAVKRARQCLRCQDRITLEEVVALAYVNGFHDGQDAMLAIEERGSANG